MGFRVSQIAVAQQDAPRLLALLSMQHTEAGDPYNETPFSGAVVGEWFVLWQNWHEEMLHEEDYARISRHIEILTCDISETSMYASTRKWIDGIEKWGVTSVGDEDAPTLYVEGAPIRPFREIRDEMQALQDQERARVAEMGGDPAQQDNFMFEIPVRLFEALAGLRYDSSHNLPFTEVVRIQRRPWWQFWRR